MKHNFINIIYILICITLLNSNVFAAEGTTVPAKPTLVSPNSHTDDYTPEFIWNKDQYATWYKVYIQDSSGVKVNKWYKASDVCSNSTCSITSTTLADGNGKWWVRGWNDAGYGEWSDGMSFHIGLYEPLKPTLVSPNSHTDDYTPEFTWNKDQYATWYKVYIQDSSGVKVNKWYKASDVCSNSTCSITSTTLADGNGKWWVRGWNDVGYGEWSDGMNFSVGILPPGEITLIYPKGSTNTVNPSFTWSKDKYATWYQVYIKDSSGVKIKNKWYKAVDLCNDNNCSLNLNNSLALGNGKWWVRGWNNQGYGNWGNGEIFVITNTANIDSDGDYIPDNIENFLNMNPNNSDEDGDGILDGLQITGNKGDKFFDKQWHIKSTGANSSPDPDSTTVEGNDLGVMDIYHSYMGYNKGNPITVQVVDTGVDINHEDLVENIDLSLSRNSNSKQMGDPKETDDSSHGTMCAGIIGARAFNGKGVRGVAPFAKIAGSNWLSYQSISELEEVWTKNDPNGKIALVSNSWGTMSAQTYTFYEDLMAYASNNLRKVNGIAKGKLFIKAAGNGRNYNHDSGLSYSSSNPYVITVAALKSDNTHASYSSPGSNILVSGYSGDYFQNSATIGTTYISGRSALVEDLEYDSNRHCYKRSSDNKCSMPTWEDDSSKNYTYGMNGTSAATPTVAGSLALVLEACPTLSWRDIKYLIAKHAKKVDNTNNTWVTNSAGLHHSIDYGFGLINPSGMINECKSGYNSLPNMVTFEKTFDPDISIPDNNTNGITYQFNITDDKIIEWIGTTVFSDHTYAGDLEIYLTSPAGTTTRLILGNNTGGPYDMSSGFRYGSVAFMGESSKGTWKIKISDIFDDDVGKLEKLKFKVFGH